MISYLNAGLVDKLYLSREKELYPYTSSKKEGTNPMRNPTTYVYNK